MAATEVRTGLTYDQYCDLPPIEGRYDVLDGELIMTAAPYAIHQWVQENVVECVRPFVRSRKLGVVLDAPIDVVIRKEPLIVRQPDVLFISKERSGWTKGRDLKKVARLHVAPELIVEILSDSDRRAIIESKLSDYREIGVLEAWLVDTDDETVTTLRLHQEGDQVIGVFRAKQQIRSEVLAEIVVAADDVFALEEY
jgi:Uma2 family endonuclease